MTNLKPVNFGINQFCGPSVLSTLTGLSTDECAAAISRVTGRKEIKAVKTDDIIKTLKILRFDVEKKSLTSQTLFGTLNNLSINDGLYVIGVPKHVVAVRVERGKVLICDNHTKEPIDARGSARLMQKVDLILKVTARELPIFVKNSILLTQSYSSANFKMTITSFNQYKNPEDNTQYVLGSFAYKDKKEYEMILEELQKALTS